MSQGSVRVIRVSIHGNIGVGKSTLIRNATRRFARHPSIRVIGVPEPTEAWVKSGALRAVIKDSARWGVSVQYMMLGTRCTYAQMLEEDLVLPAVASGEVETIVVLYERSLVDDREIFAQHAITDPALWRLYEQLVANINSPQYTDIKRMVYLRNSATVCKKHIEERARDGEDGYDLAWIEELDRRHEKMIHRAKRESDASPAAPDVVTIQYEDGMHKDDEFIDRLVAGIIADFGASD